jgi:hypothetical protein
VEQEKRVQGNFSCQYFFSNRCALLCVIEKGHHRLLSCFKPQWSESTPADISAAHISFFITRATQRERERERERDLELSLFESQTHSSTRKWNLKPTPPTECHQQQLVLHAWWVRELQLELQRQ